MIEDIILSMREYTDAFDVSVMFYGSTVSGLMTNGRSDIDLVVILRDKRDGSIVTGVDH